MNEEEKQAIELLKKLQKKTPYIIWGDGTPYNKSNQIQTILDLIERQQEQIEKLLNIKLYACDINKNKECDKKHCYINGGECDATTDITKVKYINLDNYIHKDKIRKKLEKIEELYNEKEKEEKFEYTNNQFIVDFIALVEEILEI